ncbi:MAG: glutamate 5-kinase [Chamaesiphon sp. CSU_1_12]|nr:glutamate 5-kinase [Chamaesiphon sp. CSU_1_12]
MSQTLVIKVGTSSLTRSDGRLALSAIAALVETIVDLRDRGYQIVLVSSGAVGVGAARLGMTERPKTIALKQAAAAVGQGIIMRVYDDLLREHQQPVAQILLTRSDLDRRSSYINAYNTFHELLRLGVMPIVNENDTVAVDELKFGDNDTLSARVASLIDADWLFLLTDVDRLYSADPRKFPDAQPIVQIDRIEDLTALQVQTGGAGSEWGTGGMATKIAAAAIATGAGVKTAITHGQFPQYIERILHGEPLGTQFTPQLRAANARKRWIAHGSIAVGKLYLDAGAVAAISTGGKSLLPVGIARVEGEFEATDAVQLCDASGKEIARGIVNYSSSELDRIQGHRSTDIIDLLGYLGEETVVHRDNLVLS